MRDVEYKVKTFRISEEVYKEMKSVKGSISWNLFFKELIKIKKKV